MKEKKLLWHKWMEAQIIIVWKKSERRHQLSLAGGSIGNWPVKGYGNRKHKYAQHIYKELNLNNNKKETENCFFLFAAGDCHLQMLVFLWRKHILAQNYRPAAESVRLTVACAYGSKSRYTHQKKSRNISRTRHECFPLWFSEMP